MSRRDAPSLFEIAPPKVGPGPVYQGVAAQIRALFPAVDDQGKRVKARNMGAISQARSLARAVDEASGHGGHRRQGGLQLSAMHSELREQLQALAELAGGDPFEDWLADLEREERDGSTQASHPQV